MTEPFLRDTLNPQDYYGGFKKENGSLQHHFQDIDDLTHFKTYMRQLEQPETRNFVLDFGNEDAYCAINLETEDLRALLSQPRSKCFGTRWIHLWAPEEQTESIKAMTSLYGVSERLQGLMCTAPVIHPPKPAAQPKSRRSRNQDLPVDLPVGHELDDVENAFRLKHMSEHDSLVQDNSSFKNLTFSQVTDQIWHFCSVDHGPRYTCLGYNTLFVTPGVSKETNNNGKDLPEGKRLWNWLILCNDGTVISIQENPFPRQRGMLKGDQIKVLDIVRRNVRFIFSGVSKQHLTMSESDSLVTIRVRHFNEVGPDQANIKQEDGPGLLFYYIFDDWVSSYGLIAKREHQYGVVLEELRSQMLERPIVALVNELHWLGRRLAVLKRLYQSYELIMRRVLQRQRLLRDEARSNNPAPLSFGATFGDIEFADMRQGNLISNGSAPQSRDTSVGVILTSASVARFERLVDRINLYCLSEIETCLLEKESLTFLNFNLIALKDSQAVEKLTRITILLAKATMLFLPVSLMTAYFSTELQGVKGGYTKIDYWASFAVIFFLTLVLLAMFGLASDTVEGKTIYRSLIKTFFRNSRQRLSLQRRGPRSKNEEK
ncbi:uncharacterized protein N7483_005199 [Penicillium malachiteum]|uniref:uncharacterized protein n=1 Tax=Penicillium malachiteum TaxID=1324776 RepID=UPI002546D9AD|nr:uncharacterized protein N7483_005199 [Penicillium malachiteum]KAJ5730691.1 hypothetical protein N7483_005199 [Penicillium malachiteum]